MGTDAENSDNTMKPKFSLGSGYYIYLFYFPPRLIFSRKLDQLAFRHLTVSIYGCLEEPRIPRIYAWGVSSHY